MLAHRLIERKRDGGRIEPGEWRALALAYAKGHIPDYQMAALLMACFLRGLDRTETAALTEAMLQSGERLELAHIGKPRLDKHSTGGVGDKVSLVLAPLVASLGVAVPMMSGRSLGHTGGTLDKLEAIPGFRTDLSLAEASAQIETLGCAMIGQSPEIAPADKKMYALRDATATVESIPLIAASIMSKKIAEDLTGLVLDMKRGSGAFIPELDRVLELADVMIKLGDDHGCPCVALVTAMDRPLGRSAGNAVEVAEAVEVLAGGGPADVVELTVALAREMLAAAGRDDVDPADALADGRAMDAWRRMISAQGGDPDASLPRPAERHVVPAPATGTLTRLDAYAVGVAAWRLGAGRARKEDPVASAAGVTWTANVGEQVRAGEPLLELHTDEPGRIPRALEALEGAIGVDTADRPLPLILERIDAP